MIKDGYKKTSIGYIPLDWEVKKFKDITAILRCGLASTPKYVEDGVPFLSAQNVKNGKLNLDKYKCISNELHEKLTKNTKPQKNDILMTRVGNVGDAALVDIDWEFSVYVSLTHIRMKEGYDSQFFTQLLNSSFIKRRSLQTQYKGGGVANLNVKVVEEFDMPIPPLKEQQKIAEILSSVDAAIEKTEQVIAKTEEVKKGLMQQLLTKGIGHTEFKQTTIGEIPVEWEAIKAKDIFSNVSIKNNYNEELLSVTQENGVVPRKDLESRVTMPEGSVKSYKLVVPGDFIISLRSFQGGLELSKIRGIVSPAYTILQSQIEIDEEYFKYFFKSMGFINRLNSAVIGIRDGKQISYSVFSDLYFPIPPLNEQRRISNILNNIDKRLDIEKGYLNQQQQIKQGLMQQLLTGKTRVKID